MVLYTTALQAELFMTTIAEQLALETESGSFRYSATHFSGLSVLRPLSVAAARFLRFPLAAHFVIFACATSQTNEVLATYSTVISPALECVRPGSLLHLRSSRLHHCEFRDLCSCCLSTDPEVSNDAMAFNLASTLGDDRCIMPIKPPDYSRFMLYAPRTCYAGNYAGVINASLTPSYFTNGLYPANNQIRKCGKFCVPWIYQTAKSELYCWRLL